MAFLPTSSVASPPFKGNLRGECTPGPALVDRARAHTPEAPGSPGTQSERPQPSSPEHSPGLTLQDSRIPSSKLPPRIPVWKALPTGSLYLSLVTEQICSGPRAGGTSRLLTLEQNLPFGEQLKRSWMCVGRPAASCITRASSCPPGPFQG